VTVIIEFCDPSAAVCGKEFVANRTPQKMDKKNRLAIISFLSKAKPPNVSVDRAARFHSTFAGPFKLQNTPSPLRSNELFDAFC
jgi:hypothetical protein